MKIAAFGILGCKPTCGGAEYPLDFGVIRTSAFYFTTLSARACKESPLSTLRDRQAILATLSSNQLFTTVLPQHRFHFVQAIDSGAHLRLIYYARCLCIGDLTPKIHLHLSLFFGDNGLNDRRGFFWGGVGLP